MADDTALAAALRDRLIRKQPDLEKWSRYYEGRQSLTYMAPELIREMEGRIQPVVVNWPRLVVDSLEERLDVEGFRINQRVEARLWDFWQANGLDEASQQAHVDALAMRRSYVIVGSPDTPATPRSSPWSPRRRCGLTATPAPVRSPAPSSAGPMTTTTSS